MNAALRQAARYVAYQKRFDLFAAEQLKISTQSSALAPFTLRPFQRRLLDAVDAQRAQNGWVRQVWLKSRQIGSSTLAQGLVFWRTVLNPLTNSIVVAHDVGAAQTIFGMARRFHDELPPDLRPLVRYDTKNELVFDNPSRDRDALPGLRSKIVVATAKNIHSGAGGTFQCVHLSEAARYPNPEEIQSSTLRTVPWTPGTMVLIESTARPEGHWFHEMYERAKAGDSPYQAQFIPWTDDPATRIPAPPGGLGQLDEEEQWLVANLAATPEQLAWRRATIAEMRGDIDAFRQEYPATEEECWITKDLQVFPTAQLRALKSQLASPLYRADIIAGPTALKSHDGPLWVWEPPQPGALYDIGVDTAQGIEGGDWTVAQVLKRPTGEQVAEYRIRQAPSVVIDAIDALGRWYNQAQIAVEVNEGAGYYINAILGERYPNLYIWRKRDKLKNSMSTFFGWETTLRSKKYIVSLAKDRVYRYCTSDARQRFPLIRSEALWKEMSVYVQSAPDKFEAAPGYHDDTVMAWMLALNAGNDESGLELESIAPRAVDPYPHRREPGCTCRGCEPSLWVEAHEVPGARRLVSDDIWSVTAWR